MSNPNETLDILFWLSAAAMAGVVLAIRELLG
jgi:hypothetical protein